MSAKTSILTRRLYEVTNIQQRHRINAQAMGLRNVRNQIKESIFFWHQVTGELTNTKQTEQRIDTHPPLLRKPKSVEKRQLQSN